MSTVCPTSRLRFGGGLSERLGERRRLALGCGSRDGIDDDGRVDEEDVLPIFGSLAVDGCVDRDGGSE